MTIPITKMTIAVCILMLMMETIIPVPLLVIPMVLYFLFSFQSEKNASINWGS